jgi:GlpG protein
MRLIGHLRGEEEAQTLSDFLYSQGIDNQTDPEPDGSWAIWIHSEEHLDEARDLLADFQEEPHAPKYQQASSLAAEKREKERTEQERFRKRFRTREQIWKPGVGHLTLGLIIASVAVFVISGMGTNERVLNALFITHTERMGMNITWMPGLPEVRQGHLWRLITPVFLHFNPLHIIFNMLWLYHLGGIIERRQGTWFLAIMVLVFAIGPNLSQYLFAHPRFGGMSGVVYGLLGYVWLRGRYDPRSGFFVDNFIMGFMMVWFVLCWVDFIPNVANVAHTAGLVLGLAWGWFALQKNLR